MFCISQQYVQFTENLRLRRRSFDQLKSRIEQRSTSVSSDDASPSECITSEQLAYVKSRWSGVCDRRRLWLRKLDSDLPGLLGQIGDWLCRAEDQLRAMPGDECDSAGNAVNRVQQQLADISVR